MKYAILICLILIVSATSIYAQPIPYQQLIANDYSLQNEEQVWVSPVDSAILIACWRDFRLGYRQIGMARCTDGANWGTIADSLLHPDQQIFNRQSDPTMTVDRDGNFYMCVLDYQNDSWGYDSSHLAWHVTTDNGVSWSGPYTVVDTIGPYFEDKQFTTVDRTLGAHSGNIYVAWARYYENGDPVQIMFARSTTGAVTWDDTLVVAPSIDVSACGWTFTSAGQFAQPIVGSDGSVYVFYSSLELIGPPTCEYVNGLRVAKSTDGGLSFTSPSFIRMTHGHHDVVDGGIDVYASPTAAADITTGPYSGNLYIGYANLDTTNVSFPGGDYNIEFIRSTDGGTSWSSPIYINDDIVGDGAIHDQFHPWLFCNEQEGTLAAIWYDQRLDPSHELFWVYAAYSFDGGASWTTNHRISEYHIDPNYLDAPPKRSEEPVNPGELPATSARAGKIAEYIGLTTFRDRNNAVWTGTGAEWFMDLFETGDTGQGVYAATWETPFLPPRLLSPILGSGVKNSVDSIEFSWATPWKSTSGLSYRVQILGYPNFDPLLIDTLVVGENILRLSRSDLDLNSAFYWQVKAYRSLESDSTAYSNADYFTTSSCCAVRGDVNSDDALNISDLTYFVDFLFRGGPSPVCEEEGDIDGNGETNISDLTYLVDYLFRGGSIPPPCL